MTLTVIHKQGDTALVKNSKTQKSFPVIMQEWLKHLVCIGDLAIVKRSPVTGEWFMTDYVAYMDNIGGDVNE